MSLSFNLEDFVAAPTLDVFHRCTKDNLVALAEHFEITVAKQANKAIIKTEVLSALVDRGIFPASVIPKSPRLSASMEESVRLKELEVELQRLSLEQRKVEHQTQIRLRELELAVQRQQQLKDAQFDVCRNIRLVPQFNEKDVDKYFTLFERVAESLKWPKEAWTILLQCSLVGKAQEAYASLSAEDSRDFDSVKAAVLRAYELVPEAYRQKFRKLGRQCNQSHVEFVREKVVLFDRWCSSQNVAEFKIGRAHV